MIGEGEFNLNALKEIKVTESYFALDEEDRKCQDNNYPIQNCSTDHYVEAMINQCGCLPLKMGFRNKVSYTIQYSPYPLNWAGQDNRQGRQSLFYTNCLIVS